MAELLSRQQISEVLRNARTVVVLGAHNQPEKPACYVPEYLYSQGYHIIPVNPLFAGQRLWGENVRATLAEVNQRVDIVDVFRRPDLLMGHLDDLGAMSPKPKLVWLQLGIRNDAFSQAVQAIGVDVIQDRCTLADHRSMQIGRVG
ncbi:MAG: CoA-binding protein [Polyangiaceae bacterium]|nr:CoA-binding protein [Polyangiaceae bacterium]